ncbi:MAG: hypothetical protein AB8E15_07035 [Bdellovibrionales bacterium]
MNKSIILLLSLLMTSACGITNKSVTKYKTDFNKQLDVNKDTDGDGLSDFAEQELGTDPDVFDTDKDGLSDGAEVNTHRSDPLLPDTDFGGVLDGMEVSLGHDPNDASDDIIMVAIDTDGDGLTDQEEGLLGTDPLEPDTDEDGLKDGDEVNTHHTSPLLPDSDLGGINDGQEVLAGTNPLDKSDDLTPLELTFISTPDSITNERSGVFVFNIEDIANLDKVMCAIDLEDDNSNLEMCDVGQDFAFENLAPGIHKFTVITISTNGVSNKIHYNWVIREPSYTACDPDNVIKRTQVVRFAPSNNTCAWNQGENLNPRNVYVQARNLQTEVLKIPAGADLCNLQLSSNQELRFDDHMVLAVNSKVIATNDDSLIDKSSGLAEFDFSKVVGNRWGTAKPYCIGSRATDGCEIPKHDKTGDLIFDMSSQQGQSLASQIDNSNGVEMRLSIIGDNDGSDCKHSGVEIEVEYSFSLNYESESY